MFAGAECVGVAIGFRCDDLHGPAVASYPATHNPHGPHAQADNTVKDDVMLQVIVRSLGVARTLLCIIPCRHAPLRAHGHRPSSTTVLKPGIAGQIVKVPTLGSPLTSMTATLPRWW